MPLFYSFAIPNGMMGQVPNSQVKPRVSTGWDTAACPAHDGEAPGAGSLPGVTGGLISHVKEA